MCCGSGNDRGGAFTEYVAVLILVCIAAATIVMSLDPLPIRDEVMQAVCRILQLDNCDQWFGGEESADADYEPERCLTHRYTDVTGYHVEVAVTTGTQFSLIQESFSNGEVHVSLVDTQKLEASLGAGAGINAGKLFQLGAEISVGGSVGLPNGSTWVFNSPEEAADFINDVDIWQRIGLLQQNHPISGWLADLVWGPDIPEPDIVRKGIAGEIGVEGFAGAGFGHERTKKGPTNNESDVESWELNPKLQVEGAIGVTAASSSSIDRRDGSTSTTYSLGGTARIGADWVVGDWEPSGDFAGTLTVTRDSAGQITQLTVTQTVPDDDHVTVTTIELPVGVAERAMAEELMEWVALKQALPLTWDSLTPTTEAEAVGDFEQWIFEKARLSRVRYDSEDNLREVSGSVKALVGLGLGVTWGSESLTVTKAEYLGAPADGVRSYIPYESCS